MRFFSNDARESTDDREPDGDPRDTADDRTERIQSEPVAVPGQRPPSPWATPADDRRDSVPAEPAQGYDDDPDRTQYQPTGYGAVPVAAAVSARDQETVPATGTRPEDAPVVTPVGTVESPTADNTTTYPAASTDQDAHRDEVVDVPLDDQGTFDDPKVADETQRIDTAATPGDDTPGDGTGQAALKDEGGFDDPKAVDPATDEPLRDTEARNTETRDSETRDSGGTEHPDSGARDVDASETDGRDEAAGDTGRHDLEALDAQPGAAETAQPGAAETAQPGAAETAQPGAAETAQSGAAETADSDDTPADAPETPVVAAVPVAAAPAAGPAADKAFFAEGDVQGFQERWREVQLRFVDSPKEAAEEAAKLVDEAVDKLTASLRAHKDELAGEHDDTEALRVQLRGYRDVLNRILGL
ncbi:prolipoprotein diacylglyceryl transferase [Actinoplanes sp. RD1]|uniref:hypothetical protein n=1 Tax=Actinoplanes sp. RD1 TaxID=3064538 RepID=UPI0027421A70|nr:hypothetical protein [Actinoplanes sp. RD1]